MRMKLANSALEQSQRNILVKSIKTLSLEFPQFGLREVKENGTPSIGPDDDPGVDSKRHEGYDCLLTQS